MTYFLLVQIDANMMSELREVQATVQPSDTLLVVDAMTGQEAAGLVKAFNEAAEITGAPYDVLALILCATLKMTCTKVSILACHFERGWLEPESV